MNLCSDGHDEVCYEVRNCPVCAVLAERDSLEEENDKLKEENDSLLSELGG